MAGMYMTAKKIAAPTKLNNVWNIAVLLDVLELPRAAIQEVKHVPMLAPATKHNADASVICPLPTRKTTIQVTTDED